MGTTSCTGCNACSGVEGAKDDYIDAQSAGYMYCQPQVYKSGGTGGVSYLNHNAPASKFFTKRLMESEGLVGLYKMPFFKNMNVGDWHDRIKDQGMPFKQLGLKSKKSSFETDLWRKWALHAIDEDTNAAGAQLIYQELYGLHHNVISSPTLDEYEELLKDKDLKLRNRNEFLTAIQFGLDLVLPSAIGYNRLSDIPEEELNKEVIAQGSESKVNTETSESLLTEEELEAEKEIGIDIKKVGNYGVTKSMKYIGMGAAVVGLALGMSSKAGGMMDQWISKPINRGLLFQAVAVLAIVNHGIVKKNLSKVEKNRKYVKDILDRFKVQEGTSIEGEDGANPTLAGAEGDRVLSDRSANGVTITANKFTRQKEEKEIKKLLNDLGVPCAAGREQNGDCRDPDLRGQAKKVNTSLGGIPAMQLLKPLDTLSKAYTNASRGKFDAALSGLNKLTGAKNVKGIEIATEKIQKQLNETQFANGEPLIKFKEQTDNLNKELNGIILNEADRVPGGVNAFYASYQDNQPNTALDSGTVPTAINKNKDGKKKKKVVFAAPVKFNKNKSSGKRKFNFNHSNYRKSENRKKQNRRMTSKEAFRDRNVEYNDIQKTPNKSIFKILSNRYLKSALPSFFDRVEPKVFPERKP